MQRNAMQRNATQRNATQRNVTWLGPRPSRPRIFARFASKKYMKYELTVDVNVLQGVEYRLHQLVM